MPLRTDVPEWFVLDSCQPHKVFPLQDLGNESAFNADASYVAYHQKRTTQPSRVTRSTAREEMLRHLTAQRHQHTHHQLPIACKDGPTQASRRSTGVTLGAAKGAPNATCMDRRSRVEWMRVLAGSA